MSDSLKDQLLGLGFKPSPAVDRHKGPRRGEAPGGKGQGGPRAGRGAIGKGTAGQGAAGKGGKHPGGPRGRGPRTEDDIDLAKAYAIRAQREKDERIRAEREKQEAARLRREAQAKLAALLEGKGLNAADAEHARHFEYGGRIKRVHVTGEQLRALNAGELGVVQLGGRYLLVTAATLAEAEALFPACVALKVDPDAPAADDPYSDPRYQVPDDLVW